MCENCGHPFLNSKHICDEKNDADEVDQNIPRNNMSGPGEDTYDNTWRSTDNVAQIRQCAQQ